MRPPHNSSTRRELNQTRGRARNLERRIPPVVAAAAANLSWGKVDSSPRSIPTGDSGDADHIQRADFNNFATNDDDAFEQDIVDHSATPDARYGGLLIKKQGVYLTWAGARVATATEPQSSWLYAGWGSFYYAGFQVTLQNVDQSTSQGKPGHPPASTYYWDLWNMDIVYYQPSSVDDPFMEYHVDMYNSGTQALDFLMRIFTVRLGDAVDDYPYAL